MKHCKVDITYTYYVIKCGENGLKAPGKIFIVKAMWSVGLMTENSY